MTQDTCVKEKKQVAIISVFSAIFLTGSKTVIGILTGSLGILSEALHSGLDLIAAFITFLSIRVSDAPADEDHHYGHGKTENLSALIETILLFITCIWIIYEAIHRLLTGNIHVEVNRWSYIVIISSIMIDFWRSRTLMKAARKHNSQALEADALHFSTDIWSSSVVLLGLMVSNFGWYYADVIAALIVSLIVIHVCYRLGRRSIDVLLDKAPIDKVKQINEVLRKIPGVMSFQDVKVRLSGADVFVDLSINIAPQCTIEKGHQIADDIERIIKEEIPRSEIFVHIEPEKNLP
ncbi:MAG: cation diffusion facilitator family transporter [Smithellaceae bacterium]